jgi:hypothetical protein
LTLTEPKDDAEEGTDRGEDENAPPWRETDAR